MLTKGAVGEGFPYAPHGFMTVLACVSVFTPHSHIVPSWLADARIDPSGLKITFVMSCVWPLSDWSAFPVAAFPQQDAAGHNVSCAWKRPTDASNAFRPG